MLEQRYILGLCGLAGSGKDTIADHLVRRHGYVKVSFADPLKRICKDVFDFTDEQLWGPSAKRNAADYRYPRSIKQFAEGEANMVEESDFLTPRYALQLLGTEWGRQCYQPVWVEYALRAAKRIMEDGFNYTITGGLEEPKSGGLLKEVESVIQSTSGWKDDPTIAGRLIGDIATAILHSQRDTEQPKPKGVVIADVRFKNEIAAIKEVGGRVIRVRPPQQEALAEWQMHSSETEQFLMKDSDFDGVIINPKVSFDDLFRDADAMIASLGD